MRLERVGLCSVAVLLGLLTGCPDDSEPQPAAAGSGSSHSAAGRAGHDTDADAGVQDVSEPSKPREPRAGAGGGNAGQAGKAGQHAAGSGGKPSSGAGGSPASDKPGEVSKSDPRFFLPTNEPTNTTAPVVRTDKSGATHVLYPSYASGDAFYAYCPANGCSSTKDVKSVRLDTDGTVGNAALALTADGKPRVLLSTLLRVYYGQCDKDCTDEKNWTLTSVDDHQGDRDVTGQALALDSQGRPRFIEHTYLAFLGVGQLAPKTWYVKCDADCNSPASWQRSEIFADKIWFKSQLLFDASDRAHVLTGVENVDGMSSGVKRAAYLECAGACTTPEEWNGNGLTPLYESHVEEFKPSLSLALTKQGKPRVLLIDKGGEKEGKRLIYFECNDNCTEDNWQGSILSDLKELGSGLDLTLNADDHPRFVFTLDYNIGFYRCDNASCTADDAKWELTKVEMASDLPKDNIFLWPNCTVGAWFLHEPSLALAPDGSVRVGYEATDISGGVTTVDPTQPKCVAGKDMTMSRMTLLGASSIK